ncbi:MAG: peptide chain release factor N(5)-glutamine methyltransferase [Actinobacteria bacterium]|nr:peptide chain release factor N(5)-glutamine methyltransferase [Actinomycetota bacterium]
METWNVKKILDWGIEYFNGKDVPQARLSAELLLSSVLGLSRMDLYLNYNRVLTASELQVYKKHILKRLEHVPIQYILSEAYFRNIRLYVDKNVLIPRPETELLVERSLEIAESILKEKGSITIAEIGTGSGAIALSLYTEFKKKIGSISGSRFDCTIIALDSSMGALEVARKNAQDILEDEDLVNIEFLQCDILPVKDSATFEKYREKVDLVISNPPYIKEDDYPGLPREVREYEPREALIAGKTGLEVYERILSAIFPYLTAKGPAYIIVETDPVASGGLLELIGRSTGFRDASLEKDYNKKDRILIAKRSL